MKDFRFAQWKDIGEIVKELEGERDILTELRNNLHAREEIYRSNLNTVHDMLVHAFYMVEGFTYTPTPSSSKI